MRNPMVGAHVVGLFRWGRPSNVARLIVTVRVDTIHRVLRAWLRTHVGEEVLERVSPAITNADAAPTVVLVSGRAWVVAAVDHPRPSSIFRRLARAMCACGFAASLGTQAAAGSGCPERQCLLANGAFLAAVASASPEANGSHLVHFFKNQESAEAPPGKAQLLAAAPARRLCARAKMPLGNWLLGAAFASTKPLSISGGRGGEERKNGEATERLSGQVGAGYSSHVNAPPVRVGHVPGRFQPSPGHFNYIPAAARRASS